MRIWRNICETGRNRAKPRETDETGDTARNWRETGETCAKSARNLRETDAKPARNLRENLCEVSRNDTTSSPRWGVAVSIRYIMLQVSIRHAHAPWVQVQVTVIIVCGKGVNAHADSAPAALSLL